MSFNRFQNHVLEHYCGGEFSAIETEQQINECGDTLFVFLMREAHDAEDFDNFYRMLETAIDQLRSIQGEIPA